MSLSNLAHYAGVLDALFDFAVATLIYLELRKVGRGARRAAAVLALFFVFSGLHELSERGPLLPYSAALDLAMTLGVAATLLVILPMARGMARSLIEREQVAEHEAREYARAGRHYEQLVRHRLFNPLAVVRGAAETMRARPELDRDTREQLLDSIIEASHRMEHASLHASSEAAEEHELNPAPGPHEGPRSH